jgi:hypothetical protein
VEAEAFGKRAGELISRNKGKTVGRKKEKTVTPVSGKYRLRALQRSWSQVAVLACQAQG